MRAATIVDGRIEVEERPDPVPRDGELLIRCAAPASTAPTSASARAAIRRRRAPTDVPGLECAGETPDGRRAMALLAGRRPGGARGRARAACAARAGRPDAGTQAGGFVEVFATAHDALFSQAELAPGERLLVNGAAGGVGVAAVQLGLAAGAQVTANARHHHDELERSAPTPSRRRVRRDPRAGRRREPHHDLEPPRTRRAGSRDRHRCGSRAEIEFGLLMRKRGPHPRLDVALRARSRKRQRSSRRSARSLRARTPSASRSRRRSRSSGRRTPTSASGPATSSARSSSASTRCIAARATDERSPPWMSTSQSSAEAPAATPQRFAPRSSAPRSRASRRSPSSAERACASGASRRRRGCRRPISCTRRTTRSASSA